MSQEISFMNHKIGQGYPCYVIAEMSANHAGQLSHALEIIHAAKDAGADCIKLQTYTPDTMTIDCSNEYFTIHSGTWKGENLYSLYQKAYTPWEWQADLKREAEMLGLDFLSTPFDASSVDFLEGIGVHAYKIASFELVDLPLIRYIASKGKPIILSTGMGSMEEISEAVSTIQAAGNDQVCLLKCSSAYPAIADDMNLETMRDMRARFRCVVGLSDHTLGSVSAIAAVAMGAKVIEKHFCLSRKIENPDASFSMEPEEFSRMVRDIRETERALGEVTYEMSEAEKSNRVFRRSLFAVADVRAGEVFTRDNLRIIRPGYGLPPKHIEEILGKKAACDIKRGSPMRWEMVTE